MEAVTITINGAEVGGYPGMTILDLARESGVNIPTLCHDSCLQPAGACRLCLVEEEKTGALLAACVSPVRPGMVINTRSPRVMERRKAIVQLMLASHPDSCMVCDKGNRCQLRTIAAEMGIGLLQFQSIPQSGAIEEVNPFIQRDLSKCILCARCIRADHELVVQGALDYINRGTSAKPATLDCVPLEQSECTFCGSCLAMCPTGAIMEKEPVYHGTGTAKVDTICPFCGCGCGVSLEVKDARVIRARPAAESPVNHHTLCVRGSYGFDFIQSPERLTDPLIRNEDGFQKASWEQALVRIAGELNKIKTKYGVDSLAVLGSSKCTNEENYLIQRLGRGVLGTNNIDNGSRLYNAPTRYGMGSTTGFPGSTGTLDTLEKSQVIVVIGANPPASAPAVSYAIKRAVKYHGAKLILVDPRQTGLEPFAHLWLKPRVATDVALVNCLAEIIIREKLFDEEYISRHTDNFKEFAASLKDYTPDKVSEITGVPADDIHPAAHLFAGAEKACIIYGNGITQHRQGGAGVISLANLAILTANVGNGAVFALQRENNAQGACDMGTLPDFLPGYQSIDDHEARRLFEQHWGVPLPPKPGVTALEMMEQAGNEIKGMLIFGENPASSFPSSSKQALASLDFLAVTDLFLTETAKLATVVLPASSFAEKDGSVTNFEGRVQNINRAIPPVGNSLPDWQIVLRLAERLGHPMPYISIQQVWDEIEEMVPVYNNPEDEDLEPVESSMDSRGKLPGLRRLFRGPFPSGFMRFRPAAYEQPAEATGKEYPLTLISGSVLNRFGSGVRTSQASRLKRFTPCSWVEINPEDALRLGLKDGSAVKIGSPSGAITSVSRITSAVPAGLLFAPLSFPETNINELFGSAFDRESKAPAMKSCAVRLERIDNG